VGLGAASDHRCHRLRISPQAYDEVISTYKTPIVGLMELGLVAAVLYHALNGIRVILIDFWGEGPRYQRLMLWTIGIVWVLVVVPAAVVVAIHMIGHFR
jgi:succinate dehydrogenase / fumarate reductase cytochrome b subunit